MTGTVINGFEQVLNELSNRPVREVVITKELSEEQTASLKDRLNLTISYSEIADLKETYHHLIDGIEDERITTAFSQLIVYLEKTQQRSIGHLKSTRLNSSHVAISYAVFCLKKQTQEKD